MLFTEVTLLQSISFFFRILCYISPKTGAHSIGAPTTFYVHIIIGALRYSQTSNKLRKTENNGTDKHCLKNSVFPDYVIINYCALGWRSGLIHRT